MVEKIHHAITKWINCVCPPQHTYTNAYVKTLTLNVNVLGNRAFKEVTDVKWGHRCRALTHRTHKKRKRRSRYVIFLSVILPSAHKRRPHKRRVKRQPAALQRKWPRQPKPAGTLILDLQSPELEKLLLSEPPTRLSYSVMVNGTDRLRWIKMRLKWLC